MKKSPKILRGILGLFLFLETFYNRWGNFRRLPNVHPLSITSTDVTTSFLL
jgi:hypothetical protein